MKQDMLISTNPGKNDEAIGSVPISTKSQVHQAVVAARGASAMWRELGVTGRATYLQNFYLLCQKHRDDIAKFTSREMGMPITLSKNGDMGDGLSYFQWYLANAEKILSPVTSFEDEAVKHTVFYEPIGVAAVIMPWNWPFCNFVWGVIPQLIAGNTVVFKHSEECPLVGKFLAALAKEAGMPEGVFSQVYGDGKVGALLVNENIDLISFTGSTKVGRSLYELAGRKFIRVLLELGGSAPGIVFGDVDPGSVVEALYAQRFSNSGQTCDALKRLLTHRSVADKLVKLLEEKLANVRVGYQEQDATDIGPLVAKRQLDLLEAQVGDAMAKGAHVVCGGLRPEGLDGAYYMPTILTNVTPTMRVWQEEVFGPVLPVITFDTEEEAITLANDTPYGLGAYVYTEDTKRAMRVAARVESGMVNINNTNYVVPSSPFGGYKASGIGREHGSWGLQELVQVKVVAMPK